MADSDHDLLIRIDECTEEMEKDMTVITKQLRVLNNRVGALERWRSWLSGAVATLGAVSAIIGGKLLFF